MKKLIVEVRGEWSFDAESEERFSQQTGEEVAARLVEMSEDVRVWFLSNMNDGAVATVSARIEEVSAE